MAVSVDFLSHQKIIRFGVLVFCLVCPLFIAVFPQYTGRDVSEGIIDMLPEILIYRMVLWMGKWTDQGVRPAGQRQSKERAERDSWSCLDLLSRTRKWSLSCRNSPERGQQEGPFFWKWLAGTWHHWMHSFFNLMVSSIEIKLQTKKKYRCKSWMIV